MKPRITRRQGVFVFCSISKGGHTRMVKENTKACWCFCVCEQTNFVIAREAQENKAVYFCLFADACCSRVRCV